MAGIPGVAQFSILNLTAGITVVKPTPGRVFAISIISSGAGGVYDSAVSGSLSAGNQIVNLGGAAGSVVYMGTGGFPMSQGIVVSGSGGCVYAMSYS